MSIFIEKPYLLALLISMTLGLWLWSGPAADQEEIATETATGTAHSELIFKVRVKEQQAQPLVREIVLTGRTAPLRTVTLRSEIEAQVVKINAERGTQVQQGDLIVQLATDERLLQLKEAQALVKQREFEYQAKNKLSKKGYQSQVQIAEALTLLESAKTQVEQAKLALKNTRIKAPFPGILIQRFVEQGDYVSVGDQIGELMDEDPFLVIGEVTELERHHLQVGQPATARLVTGTIVKGFIKLISMRADAATRTFSIEIEVPNPNNQLAAGITTEIHIPLQTVLAHKLSSALLSLDDQGILGVKAVDDNNRVVFYPAQFARATAKGLWLTGLPQKLRFITVGQGFVRPGDLVQPVSEVMFQFSK